MYYHPLSLRDLPLGRWWTFRVHTQNVRHTRILHSEGFALEEAIFSEMGRVTFPTDHTSLPFCEEIITLRSPHTWQPDEFPAKQNLASPGILWRSLGRFLFAGAEVPVFLLSCKKNSHQHGCCRPGLVSSQWPAAEIEMSPVFRAETPGQVFLWEPGASTTAHL